MSESLPEDHDDDSMNWVKRYKDELTVGLGYAALLVAIGSFIFLYLQLNGIKEQNKAIWYSNRPFITILPIEAGKQIREYSGLPVAFGESKLPPSRFSTLKYTIQNAGNTPASLGDIFYEIRSGTILRSDTISYKGIELAPKEKIKFLVSKLLHNDSLNIISFKIEYGLVDLNEPKNQFAMSTFYQALKSDSGWIAARIPPLLYEKVKSKVRE